MYFPNPHGVLTVGRTDDFTIITLDGLPHIFQPRTGVQRPWGGVRIWTHIHSNLNQYFATRRPVRRRDRFRRLRSTRRPILYHTGIDVDADDGVTVIYGYDRSLYIYSEVHFIAQIIAHGSAQRLLLDSP